jgi:hypothetical protein
VVRLSMLSPEALSGWKPWWPEESRKDRWEGDRGDLVVIWGWVEGC